MQLCYWNAHVVISSEFDLTDNSSATWSLVMDIISEKWVGKSAEEILFVFVCLFVCLSGSGLVQMI